MLKMISSEFIQPMSQMNNPDHTEQLSILFSSHSGSSDLWGITSYFFHKYWPDCPYTIYLGANGETYKNACPPTWIYLNIGPDISWSISLTDYLNAIDTDYVLLMLDDFMLTKKVQQENIDNAMKFILQNKVVMCRLTPNPPPDANIDSDFGYIDVANQVPYISSLQAAIWKKSFLLQLLRYNFTPWEFETKAGKTNDAKQYDNYFTATTHPFINYTHYVEKGRFYPFIKGVLDQHPYLQVDLSKRDFLTEKEASNLTKESLLSKVYALLPNRYINPMRKLFGKHEL